MNNYNTFIFDIGGTLVKTDEALLSAIELALKENSIALKDPKKVASVFGRSNLINIQTAVETSYSGNDQDLVVERCFKSFKRIFPGDVVDKFRLYPDTLKVLNYLNNKNFNLAIFTGFDKPEATFFLEKMKLATFFKITITVDDVKKPRPDPEALLLTVKKLGAKISECIYIGDAVADIQMAKNANITMACVTTGVQDNDLLKKESPDYLVNSLQEIISVLKI